MRVCLVTDWLLYMRGSEKTFAQVARRWPLAPIFTTIYRPAGIDEALRVRRIITSYLQRAPINQSNFRWLLPLYPAAVENLDVTGYDVVVSNTCAFAHGVRAAPDAVHISYCHVPLRHAWLPEAGPDAAPRMVRPMAARTLSRIRAWDLDASRRVTHYLTSSEMTQRRIEDIYGRTATIVHPPVDIARFAPGHHEDFFLVVGELVRHKRVEVALEAAKRAGRPMKVVGDGPERRRLERHFGDTAEFLGRVDDDRLADLYRRARAFVMPQVEDFGLVAVEAQASGTPVLAARAGGALETVRDGITGVLVKPGSPDEMAEAMRYVDFDRFSADDMRSQAERFSVERFRERFDAEMVRLVGDI